MSKFVAAQSERSTGRTMSRDKRAVSAIVRASLLSLFVYVAKSSRQFGRFLGEMLWSQDPLVAARRRRFATAAVALLSIFAVMPEAAHAATDLAGMAATSGNQVKAGGTFAKLVAAFLGLIMVLIGLYMLTWGKKQDPRENNNTTAFTFVIVGALIAIPATIMAVMGNSVGVGETAIDQNLGNINAGDGS